MSVPAGSLAFPNTTPTGSPLVYLDTTGALVAVTDAIQGEHGDVLDSGIFSTAFDLVYSYCPVGVVGNYAPPVVRGGVKYPRGNYTGRFYFAGSYTSHDPPFTGGAPKSVLQAVDTTGVLVQTVELGYVIGVGGLATTILTAAGDGANTVAYYGFTSTGGATTAQRKTVFAWDLVGHVALPDFATDPDRFLATQAGYPILVLRNGEVLVAWTGRNLFSTIVTHYSAAGTVLHTYTLIAGASEGTPILAAAPDNDLSFWVGFYTDDAGVYYRLQHIRISDGSVLDAIDITDTFRTTVNTTYGITWNPDLSFFLTRSTCPVPAAPATITGLANDCTLLRITVTGTAIDANAAMTLTVDGDPVSWTLVSTSATTVILQLTDPTFTNGTYCATITNPGADPSNTFCTALTCAAPPPPEAPGCVVSM